MAHVDHAAVVELLAAGAVRVLVSIEAPRDGEREVTTGVQQAAVMLAQPLAIGAELGAVPVGPEPREPRGAFGAAGPRRSERAPSPAAIGARSAR